MRFFDLLLSHVLIGVEELMLEAELLLKPDVSGPATTHGLVEASEHQPPLGNSLTSLNSRVRSGSV